MNCNHKNHKIYGVDIFKNNEYNDYCEGCEKIVNDYRQFLMKLGFPINNNIIYKYIVELGDFFKDENKEYPLEEFLSKLKLKAFL